MNRDEIILKLLEFDIFKKWHWFTFHFQFYLYKREHIFANSIVDAISNIEKRCQNTIKSLKNILAGGDFYLAHGSSLKPLHARRHRGDQQRGFMVEVQMDQEILKRRN